MKLTDNHFSKCAKMLVLIALLIANQVWAKEEDIEKNQVVITKEAQQAAGIKIEILQPQEVKELILAPGEVIPNAKLTNKITTKVSSQIIKRLVQEGEHVKSGQILAVLNSVDMAKVQGDLLLASQEWQRVKSLGKEAISGKRYSEAQVGYQHAFSTALAYGMTESEINNLLRSQKPTQAKGEYNLLASRDGTIFNINFTEGELVEPGRILLQIVDEEIVWIDAKLPPSLPRPVNVGDSAKIIANDKILTGKVIQVHHQLDETTRTRAIRLEANNSDDTLHPGQYVNCQIEDGQTKPKLALPIKSVFRTADGDWAAYVEIKQDAFQQVEVKVIEIVNDQAVIEGLKPGTRVVTDGAFFVHSELNKKGFDAHDH